MARKLFRRAEINRLGTQKGGEHCQLQVHIRERRTGIAACDRVGRRGRLQIFGIGIGNVDLVDRVIGDAGGKLAFRQLLPAETGGAPYLAFLADPHIRHSGAKIGKRNTHGNAGNRMLEAGVEINAADQSLAIDPHDDAIRIFENVDQAALMRRRGPPSRTHRLLDGRHRHSGSQRRKRCDINRSTRCRHASTSRCRPQGQRSPADQKSPLPHDPRLYP
ncbi:hypothetical protein [Neorhizobium sp. T6_25]|uniref:hypothetical protein n=1 Tax=Neorhizobium sp. T6_25 TaxID=2093833 RepID=UPI00155E1FFE|nr:hypothetical protein [Neorhizobium sp. T6_25]